MAIWSKMDSPPLKRDGFAWVGCEMRQSKPSLERSDMMAQVRKLLIPPIRRYPTLVSQPANAITLRILRGVAPGRSSWIRIGCCTMSLSFNSALKPDWPISAILGRLRCGRRSEPVAKVNRCCAPMFANRTSRLSVPRQQKPPSLKPPAATAPDYPAVSSRRSAGGTILAVAVPAPPGGQNLPGHPACRASGS
jgi:hypothetical protein